MALVTLAGQRQADDRGALTTVAHAPEEGRGPPRSPRGGRLRTNRNPGLIDDDDFRASAARLLCRHGPSGVSPAWTRASSRCRASPAGCGGLQLRAVSRRARSWAWDATPKPTRIRARILRSVHRSLSQPAGSAPRGQAGRTSRHRLALPPPQLPLTLPEVLGPWADSRTTDAHLACDGRVGKVASVPQSPGRPAAFLTWRAGALSWSP
jgi:hypothetical protein